MAGAYHGLLDFVEGNLVEIGANFSGFPIFFQISSYVFLLCNV
jgi:hypothetical protein